MRAKLHMGREYLDSAAVLNDREAIPTLQRMLDQAKGLSEQIGIARPLWIMERSPSYPGLIDQLVRSRSAALKHRYIVEILLLADQRAIDHLHTRAQDSDESVRDLALFHLTGLAKAWKGKLWGSESQKTRSCIFTRGAAARG